jgi:hypothetical protein
MTVLDTGKNQHQYNAHLLCQTRKKLYSNIYLVTPPATNFFQLDTQATSSTQLNFPALLEAPHPTKLLVHTFFQPALVALLISRRPSYQKLQLHHSIIPTTNNQGLLCAFTPDDQ